jgi:hypothetical protein
LVLLRLEYGKRGKRMKKYRVGLALFSVALCALLLFCPPTSYASPMTITFVNTGGQSSDGEYVYPYNFNFTGYSGTYQLMCISFANPVSGGESWQVNLTPVSTQANGSIYVEEAYLFNIAATAGGNQTTIAEAQWAAWWLNDAADLTTIQSDINSLGTPFANAVGGYETAAASALASNYSNLDVYVPVSGSQPNGDPLPQYFIGVAPGVPEPSSYLLFGTGLFGLAALWLRRRKIA